MMRIHERHLARSINGAVREQGGRSINLRPRHCAVSPRFRTKREVREEFRIFNRGWKRSWRMRIVEVENGGYAGVLRVR